MIGFMHWVARCATMFAFAITIAHACMQPYARQAALNAGCVELPSAFFRCRPACTFSLHLTALGCHVPNAHLSIAGAELT